MSKQQKKGIITKIGEGISSGGLIVVESQEQEKPKTGADKK